jgi:dTDP-4-dehydrorhamnose reductase
LGSHNVLLIGGNGMLGRAMRAALTARNTTFLSPPRAECDLLQPDTIRHHCRGVSTVINCAAWTDVDGAEANEPAATALNGTAVGQLATICREAGARLVHYSTDYVFAGDGTAPYRTDAPLAPLSAYGRSKAVGEQLIAQQVTHGLSALVLRTSWLYAPWSKNFIRTIAAAARARPNLRVVSDQRGRPTSSQHLADVTLRLLESNATGVLHATDGGETTWFEFATRIAAFASPTCRVDPCTTAEFPRPAPRPAYSVLDLEPTEKIIGPMPDWRTNLDAVLATLEP